MKPINKYCLALLALCASHASAKMELLEQPSRMSPLSAKSVLVAIHHDTKGFTLVGERGHILQGDGNSDWQQLQSPVSVTLTGITKLSDGTQFAIGHDAVILKKDADSEQWQKVFDGYQLSELQLSAIKQQITANKQAIAKLEDEDEIEEAEYELEELEFTMEDIQADMESGPNKPLLSIAVNNQDQLYISGAYGTLLTSKDKGQSWQLLDNNLDNPDKFHLNQVISTGESLYLVGENGMGFYSTDAGESWEMMDMPYQGSLFGISAQNDNLVAYGLQGHAMLSTDAGQSWEMLTTNTRTSLLAGTIADNGDVYMVGHGGTLVTFNLSNPQQSKIHKHPSGASFAAVSAVNNALILVGQRGVVNWQLN